MKTYKKVIIGTAVFLAGGATAYAATNAFADLDNVQQNIDTIFNIALGHKSDNEQLQSELDAEKQKLSDQENTVKDLQNQLLDKDNLITAKDQELEAKKQELAVATTDLAYQRGIVTDLESQLTSTQDELSLLEQRVSELSFYSENKVGELTE